MDMSLFTYISRRTKRPTVVARTKLRLTLPSTCATPTSLHRRMRFANYHRLLRLARHASEKKGKNNRQQSVGSESTDVDNRVYWVCGLADSGIDVAFIPLLSRSEISTLSPIFNVSQIDQSKPIFGSVHSLRSHLWK
jgi:hypothetical protein